MGKMYPGGRRQLLNDRYIVEMKGLKKIGDGEFEAEEPDPWFIFKEDGFIPKGWYEIRLHGRFDENDPPRIYFDFGAGFQERFSTPLWRDGTEYRAVCRLYKPVYNLRLDPREEPGRFRLSSIELRGLSRTGLYARSGRELAAVPIRARGRPARMRNLYGSYRERYGRYRGFAAFRHLPDSAHESLSRYERWIARNETPDRWAEPSGDIKIAVLMPVYNAPVALLDEAIASVVAQTHENWELCIADDASTMPAVRRCLKRWGKRDDRIKVVLREENGHISRASNSALERVDADWVALLDHDDVLTPFALAEVAAAIEEHPDATLIYSDEDKITEKGERFDPFFKPDFSYDMLTSMNYFNHLTVHRRDRIEAVGGWRVGFEGSQDYDLNLRVIENAAPGQIVHIPKVLYHWRAVSGSTALAQGEKTYAQEAGQRALREHLDRMGIAADVVEIEGTPYHRPRYHLPEPPPLVSLIVPTRNMRKVLETAISSILERTTYPNFEVIIVDNGSDEQDTLDYLTEIEEDERVRVLKYDHPFNYSAINNWAVRRARGSIVGLVNNDVEVIAPDWLSEMVSLAVRPGTGCVGAKLYFHNDTIQHAGVILGIGGVAGHSHKYFPRDALGYFSRLKIPQNLSAVTAACLLVNRDKYQEVGGLEERYLRVAFNDIDLCLKIQKAGYTNVFTPFSELYHYESISRGAEDRPERIERFNSEISYMRDTWGCLLDKDSFYSRHLTLRSENFVINAD